MNNTATGVANAATEMEKMQNMGVMQITRQLDEIKEQMRQMERNIERSIKRQLSPKKTDNIIEGFPETSADITSLNFASINALLRQIGLPVRGGLEDKRKRLRRHIGLDIVSMMGVHSIICSAAFTCWGLYIATCH
ncbi:hypothetical protein BDZ91DRAFT_311151 [Kalaharituber pfeilii]|nr:hypothetical protein BDZ91DRAFT_311151 [Kalaharituber pfeilii]